MAGIVEPGRGVRVVQWLGVVRAGDVSSKGSDMDVRLRWAYSR